MRSRPLPESFPPRFRELLLKGALETVVIPCTSGHQAVRLRQMLNSFRVSCKEHKQDGWEQLYRAEILTPLASMKGARRLYEPRVILRPKGSEFQTAIDHAMSLEGTPDPAETSPQGLGGLLDDFAAEVVKEEGEP